jgi:hypothetical protein
MAVPNRSVLLRDATIADAERIALLHTDSWRGSYRGMMTDAFLDGAALENRCQVWHERLRGSRADQYVRVAEDASTLIAFVCAFAARTSDRDQQTPNLRRRDTKNLPHRAESAVTASSP